MLLLDTTVLVEALRGEPSTIERLRGLNEPPLVSAITVEEIRRGMRPHERGATDDLLAWVSVVAVGQAEAQLSGDWRREHAERGIALSQADSLIAACAALRGATLATANVRDFPMPGVRVEHWPG